MPVTLRNIAMIATVTVLAMFALNQLAARSPLVRTTVRGSSVSPVPQPKSGLFSEPLLFA